MGGGGGRGRERRGMVWEKGGEGWKRAGFGASIDVCFTKEINGRSPPALASRGGRSMCVSLWPSLRLKHMCVKSVQQGLGASCRATADGGHRSSHRPEDLARSIHRTQKEEHVSLTSRPFRYGCSPTLEAGLSSVQHTHRLRT